MKRLLILFLLFAFLISLRGCGFSFAKLGDALEKDTDKQDLEALDARKDKLDAYYDKLNECYTLLDSAADEIGEKIDQNLSTSGKQSDSDNRFYLEAKEKLSAETIEKIESLYRELPELAEAASKDPDSGEAVAKAQEAMEEYYQLVMNYKGQDGDFSHDVQLGNHVLSWLSSLAGDLSDLVRKIADLGIKRKESIKEQSLS